MVLFYGFIMNEARSFMWISLPRE